MSKELKNPIAFQCTGCNTIVTDSFFLIERMNDSLIFTHAPNTLIGEEISHSVDEEDSLCTYHTVACLCKKPIGKKYVTVSQKMSSCLGNFAIATKALRGYQLGTTEEPAGPEFMTNTEINAEIVRLQRFCTYLYGKIKDAKA
ncbi:hypothetical protein NEDG_00479 [Nematocida displodere]|uniref:Protein yippee-like n=1 Tax=Nematocida displodere TaxID=1805483 RepID=A0A177EJ50_9MICR|nr:hypothetical protein NEDG_00479 [Nematocida displodere]